MSICFRFHCHCSSGRAASVTFIHNWYKTLSQITGTRHQIVNILTLQGLLTLLRMLILRGMTELPRIWVVKVGGSVAIASPERKKICFIDIRHSYFISCKSTDLKCSLHSFLHWYHMGQYHHCQQSVGSENKILRLTVELWKKRVKLWKKSLEWNNCQIPAKLWL